MLTTYIGAKMITATSHYQHLPAACMPMIAAITTTTVQPVSMLYTHSTTTTSSVWAASMTTLMALPLLSQRRQLGVGPAPFQQLYAICMQAATIIYQTKAALRQQLPYFQRHSRLLFSGENSTRSKGRGMLQWQTKPTSNCGTHQELNTRSSRRRSDSISSTN